MGTFHHGKHELHGITIVVDTDGPRLYVGRCDDIDPSGITLLDVDVHEDGEGGPSKQEYLKRAVNFGTWKKHDRVVVPQSDVTSITPLGELPAE